jgi:cytoplasmic iron level regulating protein YaaA (DUF328/UPF0246 family)
MVKILLSPAKSLDYSNSIHKPFTSEAIFLKESEQLIKKLQKFSAKKIADLMHVSMDIAQTNHHRFAHWESPILENENCKSCIEVFNGEVYKGLEGSTLTIETLEKAQEKLRILSGLYGLLKPLDLIYPYRLEMGTKWNITPKIKNLYQFWGKKLTQSLLKESPSMIVNLASTEYSKAIQFSSFKCPVITPVFKEEKGGEYKVVMMYAKHARGTMARYLIQKEIITLETIKSFGEDGYTFNEMLSNENEFVFVR